MCRLGVLNSETINKTELILLEKLCIVLHIRPKDICKTICLLDAAILNKIIKNNNLKKAIQCYVFLLLRMIF